MQSALAQVVVWGVALVAQLEVGPVVESLAVAVGLVPPLAEVWAPPVAPGPQRGREAAAPFRGEAMEEAMLKRHP